MSDLVSDKFQVKEKGRKDVRIKSRKQKRKKKKSDEFGISRATMQQRQAYTAGSPDRYLNSATQPVRLPTRPVVGMPRDSGTARRDTGQSTLKMENV